MAVTRKPSPGRNSVVGMRCLWQKNLTDALSLCYCMHICVTFLNSKHHFTPAAWAFFDDLVAVSGFGCRKGIVLNLRH